MPSSATLNKPASSLLFSAQLISNTVQSGLPQGYVIRPLALEDYDLGFLEALSHLTTVGEPSQSSFQGIAISLRVPRSK